MSGLSAGQGAYRFRYRRVEVGMSRNRAHTKSQTELRIVDSRGVATVEAETMVVWVQKVAMVVGLGMVVVAKGEASGIPGSLQK